MSEPFSAIDVVQPELASALVQKYGTPLYVYREDIVREKARRLAKAGDGFKLSYALKANTNPKLVKLVK